MAKALSKASPGPTYTTPPLMDFSIKPFSLHLKEFQDFKQKNEKQLLKEKYWIPYLSSSSHSAEEEIQAQRGLVICPRSHGDIGRENPQP